MKRPQALVDVIFYCVFCGMTLLLFAGFLALLYFRSTEFSNGCIAVVGLFGFITGILYLSTSYGLVKYAHWAWGAAMFLSIGRGIDVKGRLGQADVKAAFGIKENHV